MNDFLDWASTLSAAEGVLWLIALNVGTFAASLIAGCTATRMFEHRRITERPEPLTRGEIAYTIAGIAVNTSITIAAWYLWREGILEIRRDTGWRAWLDFPVLILLMDFGMYVLHRIAHLPWVFAIHWLHHEHDRPRPLTLFVVHPLETFGFGMLWLVVILIYPSSWLGLCLYMAANLAAGMMGHIGVEPLPAWWSRVPLLKHIGTSTFHAQHHQDRDHNFGFYTLIWDRLFGTLFPYYDARFGNVIAAETSNGDSAPAASGT